jgi:hypothetical protein
MARYIFTISYDIIADRKEEYLEAATALKNYLTIERGKNYSIYEEKGTANRFHEVYICASEEEYDTLEDGSDDITDQLIDQINNCVKEGKSRYKTLIESV